VTLKAAPNDLTGTIAAVERRLGFMTHGNTRLVSRFDVDNSDCPTNPYFRTFCVRSSVAGVLIVDTTLLGELEQFPC
jgi:hypothetical protein